MASPPAGYAEATFVFQCTGRPRQATWSLGLDDDNFTTNTPTDIAELAWNAFVDTAAPYLASHLLVGWTFLGVSAIKMLEDGPIGGQYLNAVVGTPTTNPMPVNCSVLLTKQTGGGGRRNRGRAYLPPVFPPESVVDQAGVITDAQVTQMQDWYNAAYDNLVLAELQPVLFHQSAPFTPTPITGFFIGSQIATQRRRMRS